LADRVEDAQSAESEAKEQSRDALEGYRSVIAVDGGNLEKIYDRLNASFEKSEARAQEVADRIDAIESVAGDLFDEWQDEIDQYADAPLKRKSKDLLRSMQLTTSECCPPCGAPRRPDPVSAP